MALLLVPNFAGGASTGSCEKWERLPRSAFRKDFDAGNIEARSERDIWVAGVAGPATWGVEHKSSSGWSFFPAENPGTQDNVLSHLAVVPGSGAVWLVGRYYNNDDGGFAHALIERRTGSRFVRVPAPEPGAHSTYMKAVDALSPKDAWIVGDYEEADYSSKMLVEHWNGTRWVLQRTPNPYRYNYLSAVEAISRHDVWAIGQGVGRKRKAGITTFFHYNGRRWKRKPGPRRGNYGSMVALSSHNIWAVGGAGLVAHYDGDTWKRVRRIHEHESFYAVSATSPTSIWASGQRRVDVDVGPDRFLLEHWNGTSWKRVRVPDPKQDYEALIDVEAVPGSRQVWTIGNYAGGKNATVVFHRC